ncbi:MAG: CAP domain-containing protein [Chloroflexota bacterium]|nr:CAP domain-containing protein [Chloroflexota bacterium]
MRGGESEAPPSLSFTARVSPDRLVEPEATATPAPTVRVSASPAPTVQAPATPAPSPPEADAPSAQAPAALEMPESEPPPPQEIPTPEIPDLTAAATIAPASDVPVEPPVESIPPLEAAPSIGEGLDLEFARRLVELTNEARAASGLSPLTEQPSPTSAAQKYAELHALLSPNALNHWLNGSSVQSRIEAEGYTSWTIWSENLMWGTVDPPYSAEQVMQMWLGSEAHRNNILNPAFQEIGVGCYIGMADGLVRICVQDFGARG